MKNWLSKLPSHCEFVRNTRHGKLFVKLPTSQNGNIMYCEKYPNGMVHRWFSPNVCSVIPTTSFTDWLDSFDSRIK